jgi:hypothetical protein
VSTPRTWDGAWYYAVTILSAGMLAWVPFAHAAARLGSRVRAIQATAYAALASLSFVLLTIAPVDAQGDPIGAGQAEVPIGVITALSLAAVGCAQQARVRREAYGTHRPLAPDPAIAAVLAARNKRAKAREIVARDPMMAHELRIGRPDLARDYDDGGLVDLNNASAVAIARQCELKQPVAQEIVKARAAVGGFLDVEDVFGVVDLPMERWSMVRERSVVINP